ncbi:N-acetyl-D-Glu racemase DgcA [Lentisalinibacter sediminis]|uniref:N-acetyl-D-Glu racemase DgcA n=1 Tax=Lentisalinibacter sediminis TaxID=2992237 RepID=UPI0038692FA8
MSVKLSAHLEHWQLAQPFRIAGKEWRMSPALVVELEQEGVVGRGEGQGVFYLGETAESMLAAVGGVAARIESGISREELLEVLPPGGARNAIDCALWDLQAKREGRTIWELTGIEPRAVTTVYTIGIEPTPEAMAGKAAAAEQYPVLKIKLDADRPVERLTAIRGARPDARLVADANQAWTPALLEEVLPACRELGLDMLEQPLPRDDDEALADLDSPVTLAADESCLHSGELEMAASRYGMVNIKLDKTGGLTEALRLAHGARERGLQLMVGNMVGTSLAMAPSFVIAQLCDFVDIDGPLLLKHDRPGGLSYRGGIVDVFAPSLWG